MRQVLRWVLTHMAGARSLVWTRSASLWAAGMFLLLIRHADVLPAKTIVSYIIFVSDSCRSVTT
jgi:hypothetical protein